MCKYMFREIVFSIIGSIITSIIFNLIYKHFGSFYETKLTFGRPKNNVSVFFNIFVYALIGLLLQTSSYVPMIIIGLYFAFYHNTPYDNELYLDSIVYTLFYMISMISMSMLL